MKQTIVAVLVAIIALGVLIGIALASRPIPTSVHVAQNSLTNALEVTAGDYQAIEEALQTAWRERQTPGDAFLALIERSRSGTDRIREATSVIPGTTSQLNRISNSLETFSVTLDRAAGDAESLFRDLTSFLAAATVVRERGPVLVQQLRQARLSRAATDTSDLIAGTLAYIDQPTPAVRQNLQRILATLERDQQIDSNMPREMRNLRAAVTTVIDDRTYIDSRLTGFSSTRIDDSAVNLSEAVTAAFAESLARIDKARMLLAAYAMCLLGVVGYFGLRLRQSYGQVAAANNELQQLNESLEQRVTERTQELEDALRDLRESQVQLVQAEKMSSLGQLVAGISHEINTPLLYLANNASLIAERLEQLDDFVRHCNSAFALRVADFPTREAYQQTFAGSLSTLKSTLAEEELDAAATEAKELLSDCVDGLEDLTEMAQSLKDFSRLDRAPVGNFDVNSGLDKTLVIARNTFKSKAEIIRQYGDLPEIECSPSKINQVFLNLITNAAQAIEEDGEIEIRTQRRDAEHVAITIRDNGCGIPANIIDKIRDPFFTTKEVGTGTGLGLSIVDDIIRSHGG
ncbi:MAG TPA: ATP-binding protein, partial [Gammaproteobacteria bacterium]|nr:ATP-binding protein [Gammaproteobacteria bacterium]